jgi:hypothetical protein
MGALAPWQFKRRENWQHVLGKRPSIFEAIAKDLPEHRVRLLGMAENYWQLADKIDPPRVRLGSLTEAWGLARTA